MKNAALLVVFTLVLLSVKTVSAQTNITNDYIIISNAGVTNVSEYTIALDAANWEPYRLQAVPYQLSFENGFTIQLKSAAQLIGEGVALNIESYPTSLPTAYIPPVLTLLPGNVIGMEIQSSPHTKYH